MSIERASISPHYNSQSRMPVKIFVRPTGRPDAPLEATCADMRPEMVRPGRGHFGGGHAKADFITGAYSDYKFLVVIYRGCMYIARIAFQVSLHPCGPRSVSGFYSISIEGE